MKRKMIWSLTAMLAGTGFAAAQDNVPATLPVSHDAAARTGTIVQHEAAVGCSTGCSSSFGNDYRIYGRLESLVWKLGSHFSADDAAGLPGFRASMPYGFLTTAYNLTNPLNPVQRLEPDGVTPMTKDISGIALLEPSIQSGSSLSGLDRVGGRLTIGMALDSSRDWAAELSYFQLESQSTRYRGTAAANNVQFETGLQNVVTVPVTQGNPPITTFIDTLVPVVFSADFTAVIDGRASSRLFGLEANVTHRSFTIGRTMVSEIYGLRYLDFTMNQSLAQIITVTDDIYVINGAVPPEATSSSTVLIGDYNAHNKFFGAQIGARFDSDYGRFFWNGFGKFAFGAMRQDLSINEDVFNTDITIPFAVYPAPTTQRETRDRLAFVLEGNLSAGFHITDNCSISAGYNVIVMTQVAQMNNGGATTSNGNGSISFGDAENPIPVTSVFTQGRYYAHGLTLGLEFRY